MLSLPLPLTRDAEGTQAQARRCARALFGASALSEILAYIVQCLIRSPLTSQKSKQNFRPVARIKAITNAVVQRRRVRAKPRSSRSQSFEHAHPPPVFPLQTCSGAPRRYFLMESGPQHQQSCGKFLEVPLPQSQRTVQRRCARLGTKASPLFNIATCNKLNSQRVCCCVAGHLCDLRVCEVRQRRCVASVVCVTSSRASAGQPEF